MLLTVGEIAQKHSNIMPRWLPSPYNYARWAEWVSWEGCDDQGNFIGWCPLHDRAKEHEGSAEFNWLKGIMRCQADPSCHAGKRAMSLRNVMDRMHNVSQ